MSASARQSLLRYNKSTNTSKCIPGRAATRPPPRHLGSSRTSSPSTTSTTSTSTSPSSARVNDTNRLRAALARYVNLSVADTGNSPAPHPRRARSRFHISRIATIASVFRLHAKSVSYSSGATRAKNRRRRRSRAPLPNPSTQTFDVFAASSRP